MYSAEKIFEFNPAYPSCHGSTIAELPNGDLLAAWYAGSREGAKDVAIFTARRFYGNEGWTEPEKVIKTPDGSEGNPVLFVDVADAVWLFHVTMYGDRWTQCKLCYQKSNNLGYSWDENVILREELGWMTRNKPVYLSKGGTSWQHVLQDTEILLPVYDERNWHSMVVVSGDGGETWETFGDLSSPKGVIQPTVVQRSDRSLLMLMRSRDGEVYRSTSDDLGRTWTAAIPTGLPNPNSAVDMVRLHSGNIALVYNDTLHGRTPLTVALSTDEGETWTYKQHLEIDAGEYSYPAIIQTHDGGIHITYTYRRTSIMHVEIDEAWITQDA